MYREIPKSGFFYVVHWIILSVFVLLKTHDNSFHSKNNDLQYDPFVNTRLCAHSDSRRLIQYTHTHINKYIIIYKCRCECMCTCVLYFCIISILFISKFAQVIVNDIKNKIVLMKGRPLFLGSPSPNPQLFTTLPSHCRATEKVTRTKKKKEKLKKKTTAKSIYIFGLQ